MVSLQCEHGDESPCRAEWRSVCHRSGRRTAHATVDHLLVLSQAEAVDEGIAALRTLVAPLVAMDAVMAVEALEVGEVLAAG